MSFLALSLSKCEGRTMRARNMVTPEGIML